MTEISLTSILRRNGIVTSMRALHYEHKYRNNHLFDLTGQVRINDFFTTTENLPMLDHYMIGSSILVIDSHGPLTIKSIFGFKLVICQKWLEKCAIPPIASAPGIVGLETVGLENALRGSSLEHAKNLPCQCRSTDRGCACVSGEASIMVRQQMENRSRGCSRWSCGRFLHHS